MTELHHHEPRRERHAASGTIHMKKLIIAILLIPVIAPQLFAWGEDGHRVTARIAESRLSEKARAGIRALLGERAITDKDVCLWPDMIRGQAAFKKKYPDNSTWHYIDIDIALADPDPLKLCRNDNCVLGAIERFKKVLKDPSVSEQERREALYFLVHFVGDLHQPLHCGCRHDDKGGNRVRVQYLDQIPMKGDRPLNLHWVWDENLVKAAEDGLSWEDYAKRLNDRIVAEDAAKWAAVGTKDWILESHAQTKKWVYAGIPDDWPLDGKPFPLDAGYVKRSKPAIEEQLQKAGVRLAKVLNEVFE
jgi:hypothetical protein